METIISTEVTEAAVETAEVAAAAAVITRRAAIRKTTKRKL